MQVSTIHSEQIWKSPDGDRKIWEVTLADDAGKEYHLKTYSPKIGEVGFKGDVNTYLNARGDRFVRQNTIQKPPSRPGEYQRDDNAIRAQWAIGQAINLASVKMDKEAITLPVIEKYARELYATVSRVKGEEPTPDQQAEGGRHIERFTRSAAVKDDEVEAV